MGGRKVFLILDIFTVYDMWNIHILVRKIVIHGVKTKNETQNAFSIFWSSKIFLVYSDIFKPYLTVVALGKLLEGGLV